MDEKQLLEAIRGIVQEETGKIINEKIGVLDNKIDGLREEMTGQINGLSSHIDSLQEEMTSHNRETRIIIENGYKRIENLLHEDYGRVEKNAAKGAALVECHEELKSTVADHNRALIDHKERIEKLEEVI